jgi:hypothetical protein
MISSSLGIINKANFEDRYKYDFLSYHRDDLDWFAFVVILFTVNISLVLLDDIFIFTGGSKHDGMSTQQIYNHDLHPLFHVQIILLFNHFL